MKEKLEVFEKERIKLNDDLIVSQNKSFALEKDLNKEKDVIKKELVI